MLLKNSTSIMWISCTDIPETSAQVLFVYVLSSKTTWSQNKKKILSEGVSRFLTLVSEH